MMLQQQMSASEAGRTGDSASTLAVAVSEDGGGPTNLQIFVPELQMQKCLSVSLDELIWDIKQRLLDALPQPLSQPFNYGLFLPPCDGRAGKFLLEDRPLRDYPFHDCVPYVELKYKKRVYKMLRMDEKALRSVHSKGNLRKFLEAVQSKNAQKVERLCQQGLDPNFHDSHGETPLTLAAGIPGNRAVLVQLVGGGAHLDLRNTEGQTGMHKAAFLSVADNVRALLELGASPNYKDLIGLTPLYYNMLSTESNPEVTEMLLAEAADLDVVDMHGNTALHQACKNGLPKHTEQLLFYGAQIDARNVNGNCALHVCAVNGRVDCAQLLLYRGADPALSNANGQTAVQVAQIVGNMAVANAILGHSPHSVVPFREAPRLNTRRRLSTRQMMAFGQQDSMGGGSGAGSNILRRRSLSHCSSSSTIASSQNNRFSAASVALAAQQQQQQSNTPSIAGQSTLTSSASDYGTLRRIPADSLQQHQQQQQPGFEPNTPRILVIPRGPKGFGFILRGARHADSVQLEFQPTPVVPALQFFEGVDMQGMAMRAGLRPGDFLLEINGVDVRAASHEQVVELIHQCGDTITLKVLTVDVNLLAVGEQQQQQHYAAANYASVGRRNHSVPRSALLNDGGGGGGFENSVLPQPQTHAVAPPPPPPPQRDPSTTLSFGRRSLAVGSAANTASLQFSAEHLSAFVSVDPQQQQELQQQQQQVRCASVKLSKTSAVRRISASELEHLMMVQQGGGGGASVCCSNETNQQQQIIYQQQQQIQQHYGNNNGGVAAPPKKFTSVAEMKRRKQRPPTNEQQQQQTSQNGIYGCQSLMKISASTPDLQAAEERRGGGATENIENIIYAQTGTDENGRKWILRPKTPPPPPPPPPPGTLKNSSSNNNNLDAAAVISARELEEESYEPPPSLTPNDCSSSSVAPIYASTVVVVQPNAANQQKLQKAAAPQQSSSASISSGPPAPPPPPPNLLLRPNPYSPSSSSSTSSSTTAATSKQKNSLQQNSQRHSPQQQQVPRSPTTSTASSGIGTGGGGGPQGISAEALRSVRLKPVQKAASPMKETSKKFPQQNEFQSEQQQAGSNGKICVPPPVDFNSDLRSALARRRSKVRIVEEGSESGGGSGNEEAATTTTTTNVGGDCSGAAVPSKLANNISLGASGGGNQKGSRGGVSAAAGGGVGNKNNGVAQQQQPSAQSGVGDVVGRYNGGLSLRESVLENVSGAAAKCAGAHKTTTNASSHSPPGGFIGTKKDSGYTSSRTSLEPSECGDCEQGGGSAGVATTTIAAAQHSLPVKHRVNVLSQQLLDQQAAAQPLTGGRGGGGLQKARFSPENNGVSGGGGGFLIGGSSIVRIPAVDYEQPEESFSCDSVNQREDYSSLNGEQQQQPSPSSVSNIPDEEKIPPSGAKQRESMASPIGRIEQRRKTGEFRQKPVVEWTPGDVCEWLAELELSEHDAAFASVRGVELLRFDRARYTALGVTRIAHRQKMEQSLRDYKRE